MICNISDIAVVMTLYIKPDTTLTTLLVNDNLYTPWDRGNSGLELNLCYRFVHPIKREKAKW